MRSILGNRMYLIAAAAKIAVSENIDENQSQILRAISRATDAGADILLTPEGSLSGYRSEFDAELLESALANVVRSAGEHRIGLALGTCRIEDDGECYNQIRFYDRDGEYLGFHSKILKCGTLEESPTGEINAFASTPLRTFTFHGITVGGLICNDLWANPGCTPMDDVHLLQKLGSQGARIVFHAVNGGRNGSEWSDLAFRYHESNLRMRAKAAGTWIVTVDNSSPVHLMSSAPSGVIGPDGDWRTKTKDTGIDDFVFRIELEP